MKNGLTIALFCIATILGLLAAVMAFLITYGEYTHHYPDKRQVLKVALEAGIFTLILFLILGSMLAVILPLYF
jgi:hypothetical protein